MNTKCDKCVSGFTYCEHNDVLGYRGSVGMITIAGAGSEDRARLISRHPDILSAVRALGLLSNATLTFEIKVTA